MMLDACGTNLRYGHPSGNRVGQTADPPEKDASHICTLVQKVKAARKSSDLYLQLQKWTGQGSASANALFQKN